jgi:hypothetical protein
MQSIITEQEIEMLIQTIYESGIKDINISLDEKSLISKYFYIKYYEFETTFTVAFNCLNKQKDTGICMAGILQIFLNSKKLSQMAIEIIDDFYHSDDKLYRIPNSNYVC